MGLVNNSSASRQSRQGLRAGPLFSLGQVVATPGALELLERFEVGFLTFIRRHQNGDFGSICAEDRAANFEAIHNGARLLSSYPVGDARLWIITEAADNRGCRPSTCLLLPEEY